MTTSSRRPHAVDAKVRTIRELLTSHKYAIDYYQREYKWQEKQVVELMDDLASGFLESHEEGNERRAVAKYGHYFLGSVVTSDNGDQKLIVDGQQRLTTLTLLLIALRHRIDDAEQKGQIADLIRSRKFGESSFNLNVSGRVRCMQALYDGERLPGPSTSESVNNIRGRYDDIEERLSEVVSDEALPYFADWLIENVQLSEITAHSDSDAYTIFETTNDRGLSLAPTDMLKGYLLANIDDTECRTHARRVWKERVRALDEIDEIDKSEDADCIKAWLRSQYAETARERKRDAKPQDYERIGTEFHRWVRSHKKALGLTSSMEFARMIKSDFAFYSRWYECLRLAGKKLTPGLECVHYNAQHDFTLQYPVLLASLTVTDDDDIALRKLRVVSTWLDILIHRRIWNRRAITHSTMQGAMFKAMRDIRRQDAQTVTEMLRERLNAESETFAVNDRNIGFGLRCADRKKIHLLLARMTDYVKTGSEPEQESHYAEYAQRGRKGYEIEHIWANHPERHTEEFGPAGDETAASTFAEYRDRIGGLLLLPKKINASYGDLPYAEKCEHYLKENMLARSLHEKTYEHNPGFLRFIEESGLPFRPHAEFKKADLNARQELYRKIAERIWDPERLAREAAS